MTSVGIRELRQRASDLIRRVEKGESIEVTDRGRPVAMLVPVRASDPLQMLRDAGEVIPAKASMADLPPPLKLKKGEIPPSVILERLREERLRDER